MDSTSSCKLTDWLALPLIGLTKISLTKPILTTHLPWNLLCGFTSVMYSSTLSPWTEQNTDSHSQPNSVWLSVSMSVPYYFFIPWLGYTTPHQNWRRNAHMPGPGMIFMLFKSKTSLEDKKTHSPHPFKLFVKLFVSWYLRWIITCSLLCISKLIFANPDAFAGNRNCSFCNIYG